MSDFKIVAWIRSLSGAPRQCSRPRIALISDQLTYDCLAAETNVRSVTSLNYAFLFRTFKPDFLLVESAWEGCRNTWKYRIASYPECPERTNRALAKVVTYAQEHDIPCVFWNKEDGVHFDRFIDSAKLFDHIFTVDENCISRYRAVVSSHTTVNTLLFAVQPTIHYFTGSTPKYAKACFVGSYRRHIHPRRRELQHMLFETAATQLGLTVFDRNSARKSANYRYPGNISLEVQPAVRHAATAPIYKDYMVSLNVNTVEDSPTMFSRRLIEIFACGGLAVTTPALSIDRLFAPYCHVIHSVGEAKELFVRLKREGLSPRDREMAAAAAEHVAKHHTWSHRLREICEVVGITP